MLAPQSEEFLGLVDSIYDEGLREPIVMHEGQLVDGRNRLAACKHANVEPRFVEWRDISNGKDLLGWIFSKNYHRRHLTEEQRVMVHTEFNRIEIEQHAAKAKAKAAENLTPGNPKEKRGLSVDTKSCPPKGTREKHARSTVGKIAAAAGVSHHKAAQAVALDKAAQTDPQAKALQEKVIAGEIKLKDAVKRVAPATEKKTKPEKKAREPRISGMFEVVIDPFNSKIKSVREVDVDPHHSCISLVVDGSRALTKSFLKGIKPDANSKAIWEAVRNHAKEHTKEPAPPPAVGDLDTQLAQRWRTFMDDIPVTDHMRVRQWIAAKLKEAAL